MIRRLAALALVGTALSGGLALAQNASPEAAALALARRQADEAARRSDALQRQAAQATDAAARAHAEAAALAARIEGAEADITAAEARLRIIESRRAEQRARLAHRQEPLIHLTAALQTMSRRPPALAMVQPGTMTDVVHVRSLLASTLPLIRARTTGLRAEMAEANRLRAQADLALASLADGREELRKQRTAFAVLETRERQRSEELAQSALFESDRALAFSEEARELGEEFDDRRHREEVRGRLMELPAPRLRPATGGTARADRAERSGPLYLVPVEGRLVRGMGELSDAGVHARGLTFETAGRAGVVAPSSGRIVYAAPFRGYGNVVVIDHGGGWTTTITNLGTLAVRNGETVAMGAPVGRTGSGQPRLSVELRRNGRPFPIAPLIAQS